MSGRVKYHNQDPNEDVKSFDVRFSIRGQMNSMLRVQVTGYMETWALGTRAALLKTWAWLEMDICMKYM